MRKPIARIFGAVSVAALALLMGEMSAHATDGTFLDGVGARNKALAGAGVANGTDATAAAVNPAGITNVPGTEIDISVSAFYPQRGFTGSGQPGFTPSGTVNSGDPVFIIPNMAASWKVRDNALFDSLAFTVYGNGGGDTLYGDVANPSCAGAGGGSGVFCGGQAGMSLQQTMISLAFAKRMGNVSVGVAPIVSLQQFSARGLGVFGNFNASTNANALTNNGLDTVYGFGVKAGIEAMVAPGFKVGLAGTSPIWSQKFSKYSGLLPNGGNADIPGTIQAGISYSLSPTLTAMVDYKRIFYASAPLYGNASTNISLCGFGASPQYCLGGSSGPGFGAKDMDIIKVGLEWRASDVLTLRGGYSYNTQSAQQQNVQFDLFAPTVVQHHITGGLSYKMTKNLDLELAGMYAPRVNFSGYEFAPPLGNPGHTIDLNMSQYEITAGFKYRFDSTPLPTMK